MPVDDEPDITSIFKSALSKRGLEVDVFNDPKEALTHFKPDYYSGALLDVRMPEMTGYQLAKELWNIDSNLRIGFMSAFEIYAYDARKEFPTISEDCFITKPISISVLTEKMEKCLKITAN